MEIVINLSGKNCEEINQRGLMALEALRSLKRIDMDLFDESDPFSRQIRLTRFHLDPKRAIDVAEFMIKDHGIGPAGAAAGKAHVQFLSI